MLWLFGDTTLANPDSRGAELRGDSWLLTKDLGASDGIDGFEQRLDAWGGPAELFTYTAEELAFNEAHAAYDPGCAEPCGARLLLSPLGVVQDSAASQVLVFYEKLLDPGPGEEREPLGSSIALWSDLEFGPIRPVLDAGAEEPSLLFTALEPRFGQAALLEFGELYTFACTDAVFHPCLLARVEVERVFEREAWEFWTGASWGVELSEATTVFEGRPTLSVHRNHLADRYLAIYAGEDADSQRVLLRSAPQLVGPWSEPLLVFDAGEDIDSALAHRDYGRMGGAIEYVGYSVDGRLRLLELELDAAASTL